MTLAVCNMYKLYSHRACSPEEYIVEKRLFYSKKNNIKRIKLYITYTQRVVLSMCITCSIVCSFFFEYCSSKSVDAIWRLWLLKNVIKKRQLASLVGKGLTMISECLLGLYSSKSNREQESNYLHVRIVFINLVSQDRRI